jgi:fatty acid desaturase
MHQKSLVEQQLENITLYVTVRWLFAVCIDWGIIIGSMWFAITGGAWWMYVIAIFLVGNRVQGLALLGHEGAHYMVAKNKNINNFLTNIFTFYAYGFNVEPYRVMHIKHHEYLGSQLDPELDEKRKTATAWDLPMSMRDMIIRFLRDLSFGAIREELSFVAWLGKPKSKIDLMIHILWYVSIVSTLYMLGGSHAYC